MHEMNTAPSSDPRVADLVRAGRLRAALFLPQYRRDANGEFCGVWVEVVRALGRHIGLSVEILALSTPAEMLACLADGGCDVASLGFDPARANQVGGFSPPFIQVSYTYLVPPGSAIGSTVDVDHPGVRIAAVCDHASTLALTRIIKHAEFIIIDTPDQAFEALRCGGADAWATILPTALAYAVRLSGARVLDGSYGVNRPALVVPKGQTARLAYISEFVEHAKTSGLVQRAIDRAGETGYRVADRSLESAS